MNSLSANPVFVGYAISVLVLCAKLLMLWGYSGSVRGKRSLTSRLYTISLFPSSSVLVASN